MLLILIKEYEISKIQEKSNDNMAEILNSKKFTSEYGPPEYGPPEEQGFYSLPVEDWFSGHQP